MTISSMKGVALDDDPGLEQPDSLPGEQEELEKKAQQRERERQEYGAK